MYINTPTYPPTHTLTQSYIRVYTHAYIHTYKYTYKYTYTRLHIRLLIPLFTCLYTRIYSLTYTIINTPIHTPTRLYAYTHINCALDYTQCTYNAPLALEREYSRSVSLSQQCNCRPLYLLLIEHVHLEKSDLQRKVIFREK